MDKTLLKIYRYILLTVKFLAIAVALMIMMIDDGPMTKLMIAFFLVLPSACLVAYTMHLAAERVNEMIIESEC